MPFESRFQFLTSTQFLTRFFSSIILIAFAVFVSWLGGWLFNGVWLALALLVGMEWFRIVKGSTMIWLIAGLIYVILTALGPILLRYDDVLGFQVLMWAFGIIWTTDIMAYLFGRSIGGVRLWPRVSPNKTWAGFLGGVLSGACFGILLAYFWIEVPNLAPVALIALLAAVATQAGDLLESQVKRCFDVKDSGSIIPGHGGVMDRLDGCIVACSLIALLGMYRAGWEHAAQGILLW